MGLHIFSFNHNYFYLYGSQSKKVFTEAEINSIDHKVRVIGSNIKLDRFYSNVDPITVIEDLIDLSKPDKNEKIIFVWPEGILPGISQEKFGDYKGLFENHFNENHLLVLGINSKSVQRGTVKYFNSLS